jgi:hypothetical protein
MPRQLCCGVRRRSLDCLLDVDFFVEGTTANNFAQIQNQYLLPMSLGICLSGLAMQDITKIGLLMLIETGKH